MYYIVETVKSFEQAATDLEGKTMIGLIKPVEMLAPLSQDATLLGVAKEVEESTIRMVDEAK